MISPLVLWKELPAEKRLAAAEAFWNDENGLEQQVEMIMAMARRLNFRAKSVQSLPIARRAKLLTQSPDISGAVAARALIAYHLTHERAMMAAFLDALGIAHDNGLITAEDVAAPPKEALQKGVAALRSSFPPDSVRLYLHTLVVLDADTWTGLDELAEARG